MKRSVAVTLAAILLLLGSALMVLVGLVTAFGLILLSLQRATGLDPDSLVAGAVFAGPGMLGLATGVGLLLRRPWARFSAILIGSILCLIALCVGSSVLFDHRPLPPHPAATEGVILTGRLFVATFYLLLFALGAWWLYLFNRRSVKAEFRPNLAASPQGGR